MRNRNEKKYYFIAWSIAVIVFHIVLFLFPDTIIGPKDKGFWTIYLVVLASFIIQAVCSNFYLNKEKKEELFLYVPVVTISYIALFVTILLALQAWILDFLPDWLTLIIIILVEAYYCFAVIRAITAANLIIDIDKKVEQKTSFIRNLTAQARTLEQTASTELLPQVKKVYESFYYSDPMSCEELAVVEEKIEKSYETFSIAVKQQEKENVERIAKDICNLLKERNALCKQFKR